MKIENNKILNTHFNETQVRSNADTKYYLV